MPALAPLHANIVSEKKYTDTRHRGDFITEDEYRAHQDKKWYEAAKDAASRTAAANRSRGGTMFSHGTPGESFVPNPIGHVPLTWPAPGGIISTSERETAEALLLFLGQTLKL